MEKIKGSVSVGKIAYKHDIRKSLKNNVTPELSSDNVILIDKLQGMSIEEYTDKKMQSIVNEYNSHQKKKCRRLSTYCEWHKNKKKNVELAYEAVIQYGEHEDLGRKYYESTSKEEKETIREEYIKVYRHVLSEIYKKFPHIDILYATIHFDEEKGTPHMHLCYQGVGEDYKIGLSRQISIGKALTNDGIERVENRTDAEENGYQLKRFYNTIRNEFLYPELKKRGYTIDRTEIHGRKHLTTEQYATLMQSTPMQRIINKLEQAKALNDITVANAKKELYESIKEANETIQRYQRIVNTVKNEVIIQKKKEQAQQSIDNAIKLLNNNKGLYDEIDYE